MKSLSNTIDITSPPSSDDLPSVVKLKINPTELRNCGWSMPFVVKRKINTAEKQFRRGACELPMAQARHGIAPIPAIRTLLVDDSPAMLNILAQVLAAENRFTVVGSATDGCQALRLAMDLKPELVLMDLNLPELNGAQAASYIKDFSNPPVVFLMTSDDSSNSRAISKAAGADAFIVKSGDLRAQLRAKLQEWFGSTANPVDDTE